MLSRYFGAYHGTDCGYQFNKVDAMVMKSFIPPYRGFQTLFCHRSGYDLTATLSRIIVRSNTNG